jgi:3-dehydroquinate synthase
VAEPTTVRVASGSPYDVVVGRGITGAVADALAEGGALAGAARVAVLHQPAVEPVARGVIEGLEAAGAEVHRVELP